MSALKKKPSRIGELIDDVLDEIERDTPYRPEAVATVAAWPAVVPVKMSVRNCCSTKKKSSAGLTSAWELRWWEILFSR